VRPDRIATEACADLAWRLAELTPPGEPIRVEVSIDGVRARAELCGTGHRLVQARPPPRRLPHRRLLPPPP